MQLLSVGKAIWCSHFVATRTMYDRVNDTKLLLPLGQRDLFSYIFVSPCHGSAAVC